MVTDRVAQLNDSVETPRDAQGDVDYNLGWKLWTDMNRYYPSAVHRRRLIVKWLQPLNPRSVIEVGCGLGLQLVELRAVMGDSEYWGVDFAGETMAMNQKVMPWCHFEQCDISNASINRTFDAVVCSEVLEHVHDDNSALAALCRMTARHLLLTVPTGPIYPTERGFGHLRHYDIDELCARIRSHGLIVDRARRWGFPMMNLFKWSANLRASTTMRAFGAGSWSPGKRALARLLTALFYVNWPNSGPQILILASRPPA